MKNKLIEIICWLHACSEQGATNFNQYKSLFVDGILERKVLKGSSPDVARRGGRTLTPALAGVKGGDVLPHGFTLHSGRAPQPHAGDCWPDHG